MFTSTGKHNFKWSNKTIKKLVEGLQESPETETEINDKANALNNTYMEKRNQKTKKETLNEIPTNEKMTKIENEKTSKTDELVTLFYKGDNDLEIPDWRRLCCNFIRGANRQRNSILSTVTDKLSDAHRVSLVLPMSLDSSNDMVNVVC